MFEDIVMNNGKIYDTKGSTKIIYL